MAMEVIGTPEFNDLDGGVNTFSNILYIRGGEMEEYHTVVH